MSEYASNGVANAGLVTGIAGSALGLLNGGLGLFGSNPKENYVTQKELNMAQELASKDGKIALLEAENHADRKMVEVYTATHNEIKELAAEVRANKDAQMAVNLTQAVHNGVADSAIAALNTQIAGLNSVVQGVTKVVIPNTNVSPGWGNVTITPAVSTTSGTTTTTTA